MKTYLKHIQFKNIQLTLNQQHPKEFSRVYLQFIQNHQNLTNGQIQNQKNKIYQTKKYATISNNSIKWTFPIEFLYEAQQFFNFQTICQHEYGYQIKDLKANYYGQIHIKPEDFFITKYFPIFDKQSKNCGQLSFMIKIIDRQVGVQYNSQDQVSDIKQRIKIDLKAQVSFLQAILIINPLIFNFQGKKGISKKSIFTIQLNGKKIIGKQKQPNKWIFNYDNSQQKNKLEILQNDVSNKLKIKIQQSSSIIMSGQLPINILLKNKRFLNQSIQVTNEKGQKIATIKLQLRVIQKKQILDLMYSPKKLRNIKMESTQFQTQFSRLKSNLQNQPRSSQPVLNMKKKFSLDTKSKDSSYFKKSSKLDSSQTTTSASKISKNQKYNIYLKNRYQEVKFPISKRFNDIKPNNPYVSYSGQQNGSDFSPRNKRKGADLSKTQRTDFTKPFKNNPGTGDYHLPSIWEKS